MVRKKIAMAVLALSALQADVANALGLGNVAVKSSLNQPLNAEIRLLDTGELDDTQIKVSLASPDDFQRAGVERDYFLTNLRFSVELDKRGNGMIRVTTREAVVEPYLSFIVETRWPSGRLLREYSVLLDPPTFSATPAAPTTGSGVATVQQRAQSQPTPTYAAPQQATTATPVRQQSLAQPAASGNDQYRVQHNDTLSSIAARFRPADDVNVQQTMVAIQQANPQAFIRGNINLVKSGYVLRIPAADAVRAISGDSAATTVQAHNEAWRTGGTPAEALAGPQLDARRPAGGEAAGLQDRERLSIATAGDSSRPTAGDGASGASAGDATLRNELTLAQEGLDSARRDNEELESRLDDMERQIATLQRLLTLKDDQLAAMQAAAGTAPVALADSDSRDSAGNDDESALVPLPGSAPTGSDIADGSRPDDSTPPPVAPVPPAAPATSLLDQLMASTWLPIAGGAALILLLAALVIAQRRRAAAEREALAELEADMPPVTFAVDEQLKLDDVMVSDDGIVDSRATAAAPVVPLVSEAARAPVRAETGDAISEADIYMAYGRYPQAVDLLRAAIDVEPQRSDLRVKLLEVYVEMRERDAFRAEFRALQALGDEQAIVHVKEILSSVDGASGWLDDLGGGVSPLAAAGVGGTLAAAAYAGAADADDDEFIFDDAEATSDGADSDELLLDLDLDELDQPQSGDEQALDFAGLEFSAPDDNAPATASTAVDDLGVDERADQQPVATEAAAIEFDLDEELGEELDAGLGDSYPLDAEPVTAGEQPLEPELDAAADVTDGFVLDLDDELNLEGELDLDLADLAQDAESLDAAFGVGSLEEIEPADGARSDAVAALEPADDEASSWSFDAELDAEPLSHNLSSLDSEAAEASALTDELQPASMDDTDEITLAFDELASDLDEQPLVTGDEPATLIEPGQAPEVIPELEVEGLGDLTESEAELGELDTLGGFDDLDQLGAVMDGAAAQDPLTALADLDFAAGAQGAAGEVADNALAADSFDLAADAPFDDAELTDLPPYTPEVAAADADDEFDFLADTDEVATKLDLARAYLDMGDTAGARDILDEVVLEGNDPQREEAQGLLSRLA